MASVIMPTMLCTSPLFMLGCCLSAASVKGAGMRGSMLAEGKVVLKVEEPVEAVLPAASPAVSEVCSASALLVFSELSVSCVLSCVSVFSALSSDWSEAPQPLKVMQPIRRKVSNFL